MQIATPVQHFWKTVAKAASRHVRILMEIITWETSLTLWIAQNTIPAYGIRMRTGLQRSRLSGPASPVYCSMSRMRITVGVTIPKIQDASRMVAKVGLNVHTRSMRRLGDE